MPEKSDKGNVSPKKKIVPYSDEWERVADRLARDYTPSIHPCKGCNYPVVIGYTCSYCGNTDPR